MKSSNNKLYEMIPQEVQFVRFDFNLLLISRSTRSIKQFIKHMINDT